jgi:hypothetical protein
MRPSFALTVFLLLSHSASAAISMVCEPTVIQSGREVTTQMSGTAIDGAEALREMQSTGKSIHHRDALGRSMFVDSRVLVRTIDGTSPENDAKGVYPMARIERYCSKSAERKAICIDLCTRWTNFEDPRL